MLEERREHGLPKTIKLLRTCSYPFYCNRVRESERQIFLAGFHTLSAIYTIYYYYLKHTPAATPPIEIFLTLGHVCAHPLCTVYTSTHLVLCLLLFSETSVKNYHIQVTREAAELAAAQPLLMRSLSQHQIWPMKQHSCKWF